jgi:hypothetical protein
MLSNQTKVSFTVIRLIIVFLLLISLLAGSTSSDNPKTVHVREYTRKDGTVVHAHDRAAPGTASHATVPQTPSSTTTEPTPTTTAPTIAAPVTTVPAAATEYTSTVIKRNSRGRIERSSFAKRAFEASHPCPSTGSNSGPCKGYVIDHVKPLACGGADAPENMQWQTAAAAKAKDKVERVGCYAP